MNTLKVDTVIADSLPQERGADLCQERSNMHVHLQLQEVSDCGQAAQGGAHKVQKW